MNVPRLSELALDNNVGRLSRFVHEIAQDGVDLINKLQGAASIFGADTALFAAWGGFTRPAREPTTNQWFQLRIWNSRDLIEKITENYDKTPGTYPGQAPPETDMYPDFL